MIHTNVLHFCAILATYYHNSPSIPNSLFERGNESLAKREGAFEWLMPTLFLKFKKFDSNYSQPSHAKSSLMRLLRQWNLFGRSILGGQMMKFSKMKREPLKFGRAQKNLRLSSALIMPVILWTILAKTAYSNVLKSKVLTQNRKLQNFCIKSLSAALVQNEQR